MSHSAINELSMNVYVCVSHIHLSLFGLVRPFSNGAEKGTKTLNSGLYLIYIHIYTYICMYIYMYVYVYIHIYSCMGRDTQTHVR